MMRRVVENNDAYALDKAIDAIYPFAYVIADNILENEDQVDDIMHDVSVLMGAVRDKKPDYTQYLLDFAKDRALRIYAARSRNRVPDLCDLIALPPKIDTREIVIGDKTPAEIMLDNMPEGTDKDLLILHHYLGLTCRSLSVVTGLPKTTVDRRMKRCVRLALENFRPDQLGPETVRLLNPDFRVPAPEAALDPVSGKATHGRLNRLRKQKNRKKLSEKTGQSIFTQNSTKISPQNPRKPVLP